MIDDDDDFTEQNVKRVIERGSPVPEPPPAGFESWHAFFQKRRVDIWMAAQEGGGPAYPGFVQRPDEILGPGLVAEHFAGMSLRDWYAGMAMQGLASADNPKEASEFWRVAGDAFELAKGIATRKVTGAFNKERSK